MMQVRVIDLKGALTSADNPEQRNKKQGGVSERMVVGVEGEGSTWWW